MILGAAVELEQQMKRRLAAWTLEDEVAVGHSDTAKEFMSAALAAPLENLAAGLAQIDDEGVASSLVSVRCASVAEPATAS